MSKFEVIRGVEGCCLALDDTRIAGPKPWGGGTVIHAWETDKEYKAVDTQSRWHELFGSPERAARTLARMDVDAFNWCVNSSGNPEDCRSCPYEYDYYGCYLPEKFSILEWLSGDA